MRLQLPRRRSALADAWNLSDELVLIGAGSPVTIPGRRDRAYRFHAHLEYLYLTDRERPGGVLAYDSADGWIDFVTPVTRNERLWEGAGDDDPVGTTPIDELAGWLEQRRGRPVALLGAPVEQAPEHDEGLSEQLRLQLNHVRRPKDELELERMRHAERATAAGFARLVELIEPGRTERALQIELEAEFFRHGADDVAFDTIVAGGPNSAVSISRQLTGSFGPASSCSSTRAPSTAATTATSPARTPSRECSPPSSASFTLSSTARWKRRGAMPAGHGVHRRSSHRSAGDRGRAERLRPLAR